MAVASPAVARASAHVSRSDRSTRTQLERLAYLSLFLVLVVIVFANRWGQISPDWVPQLYLAPVKTFFGSLSAWRSQPFLGQPNIHAGLAPTAAVISLIRLLGVPAWVAIRVFRILMLIAAGWGAMRLFDRLAGQSSGSVGRLTVVVAYAANPFVIVNGSWMPTLLPYALFPWLLLALDRSVHQPRSWRWPAAFALVFFAMGGVNGGVVPLLLAGLGVPAYLAYAQLAGIAPLRSGLAATARCLFLSMLISLYWLMPTLFGRGSGSSIAATSEHPAEVAATSSYSEVFRLLGFWLMYGYRPNQASYGSFPLVLAATFLVPAAALFSLWLSRARLRILSTTLLAVSIPVMVGIFPSDGPTPFGRAMRWAFAHVSGAIAFRTTTKAGALPALAFSLLLGLGAQEVARSRLRVPARAGLACLAVIVVALTVYPALAGELYPSGWRVPRYWRQAAKDLNSGSTESRVLFLPGNYLAVYRWGMREVEDLNDSLLDRPSAVRTVLIYGTTYGANLLSAVDTDLQTGRYRKGTVPALARYLGASAVLLRNDMAWEESGGMRPYRLALQLYEPGLKLERSYGKPGENVVALPTSDRASATWSDQQLPPLQRFSVAAPRPSVRTEAVSGVVLVDGDNFALGPMVEAGLLAGDPSFRLLGSMDPDELFRAARDNGRIVLTDSNRRRIWTFRRTDQDATATLTAKDGIGRGKESYALFWNQPERQTVVELHGARAVHASGYGSVFGPVPSSRPALAFDGDEHTAWLVGDYGTSLGQWIRIDLERQTTLTHLILHQALGGSVEVRSVRLTVGSRTIDVAVPERASVPISFPPTRASSVRIQITGTRGVGTNPVGFREIAIPGTRVTEVIRLPRTFTELVRRLQADERDFVLSRPVDILLTRQAGDPATRVDDEERTLVRAFTLPNPRVFSFSGAVEAGPDLPDETIDDLAGLPSDVVATSSARAFGSIFNRASQVLDGDPDTAWVPTGPGDRIQLSFPPERLNHIVIHQAERRERSATFISEMTLSLDEGPPFPVRLSPHETLIRFRPRTVHRVTLAINRIDGLGGEVRVGEVQVGHVRVPHTGEATPLQRCVRLFTVDGRTVSASLAGTLGQLASGASVPIAPCKEAPISLFSGEHRLQGSPGWLIDTLLLNTIPRVPPSGVLQSTRARLSHDTIGLNAETSAFRPPSRLTVTSSSPTRIEVRATRASSPYYVVAGQAFDDRWTATMDGRPLGKPIVVDGYSVGWRIDDQQAHRFVISFAPQRWVTFAQILSAAGLLLVLLLLVWPRRRGQVHGLEPDLSYRRDVQEDGSIGRLAARPPANRPRRALITLLAGSMLWFVGGWAGVAAGALSGVVLLGTRWPATRFRQGPSGRDAALAVPAALLATVPLILLFNGLPPASQLTPAFVSRNVLASHLAEVALVLAVAAVFVDARRHAASQPERSREAADTPPAPGAIGTGGRRLRVSFWRRG